MKAFAHNFFTHFNARIAPQENEWVVDLPPDLAEAFGKPRLYLVFPGEASTMRELSPHEDLLVYGSRTFDTMLGLLAGRGETAQIQLPRRFPPHEDQLPPALSLGNCQLLACRGTTTQAPFTFFNFRAVYRSTEKQEELLTIVLDSHGKPRPDLADIFSESVTMTRPDPPPAIDLDHLKELMAEANAAAREHVEARAADIETGIAPRLEKTLLRLTTYYRRLTDEVNTGDEEKDETVRAELQAELKQQMADELERHRLRVTLKPISYALAHLPLTDYTVTLATAHTEQTLTFFQNLHTGEIETLTCRHCREPLAQISLCDRSHPNDSSPAVHPHCLERCRRCERDICHACGIDTCALCRQAVCVDCVAACDYCDRWLCAAHIKTCAGCGANFCPEHAYHCQLCGQTYCRQCQAQTTCTTCRAALDDPAPGPGSLLAWLAVDDIDLDRFRWRTGQNQVHTVYLGRPTSGLSFLRDQVVLVVNKSGQVVYRQKIGWFRRWQQKLT